MKTIISLIIMGLSVLMSQAQVIVYDETKASQFEKNLVSTAIQLADTFGPDYEVKNAVRVEINGPFVFQHDEIYDRIAEIQKNDGRTYYDVTFYAPDPSSYDLGYLSKASIWSDGKPKAVSFGNGFGIHSYFSSFEDLKKQANFLKSLVPTAIQVSDTFGPNWNVKNAAKVEISGPLVFQDTDMRPEIQKHVGRTYYDVTFFPQDPSSIIYSRLSTVSILSDGEPLFVIFGNSYGVNFFFKSFEELKKHTSFTVPMEKVKIEKVL
ncbi:MAG: hypothetical protein K2K72_01715 [Duncaniella sp.]|nr:hypothetical protein [Duncaniella sp.]